MKAAFNGDDFNAFVKATEKLMNINNDRVISEHRDYFNVFKSKSGNVCIYWTNLVCGVLIQSVNKIDFEFKQFCLKKNFIPKGFGNFSLVIKSGVENDFVVVENEGCINVVVKTIASPFHIELSETDIFDERNLSGDVSTTACVLKHFLREKGKKTVERFGVIITPRYLETKEQSVVMVGFDFFSFICKNGFYDFKFNSKPNGNFGMRQPDKSVLFYNRTNEIVVQIVPLILY